VGGTYRFLKNISALWLIQECRRAWRSEGREFSYDELTELARQARPFLALVNPGDSFFLSPGSMPARIRQYCRLHGSAQPESTGEFVRVTLESLALAYRQVIEQMSSVIGYRPEVIHIVGGGSRNDLLNQFSADASGLPVVAGPVEATSMGNLLLQAIALGDLSSIREARELVRNSFPLKVYEPGPRAAWDEQYERWLELGAS
jgi:rhamnulokinase